MNYDTARRVPTGTVYERFPGSFIIADPHADDDTRSKGACATCGHAVLVGKSARRLADNAVVHIYDCRNAY